MSQPVDRGERKSAKREAHPLARIGAVGLVIAVAIGKTAATHSLAHDGRAYLFVIFGLAAVMTFYRGRPLSCAAALSVIVALAVHPHPLRDGVLLGAVIFVALAVASILASWLMTRLDRVDAATGRGWLS